MKSKYPNKKQVIFFYKTQSPDNPLYLKRKLKKSFKNEGKELNQLKLVCQTHNPDHKIIMTQQNQIDTK